MSVSISAKLMTDLFQLWPKMTAEERQKKYEEALEKGWNEETSPRSMYN